MCALFAQGERRWDASLVRQVFGEHLAERVLALPIPEGEAVDRRVWSRTGRTIVRVRNLLSIGRGPSARQMDCSWIWRMHIHPQVALFLWKVAWGCLPTSGILVRRGVRVPAGCGACQATEETIYHVFFGAGEPVRYGDMLQLSLTRGRCRRPLRSSYDIWRSRSGGLYKRRGGLVMPIWPITVGWREMHGFSTARASIRGWWRTELYGMRRRSPTLLRLHLLGWSGISGAPILLLQRTGRYWYPGCSHPLAFSK